MEPLVARNHAVRDVEAPADQLERGLAHLFVVVDVHRFAERRELLVVGEGYHLVEGLVACRHRGELGVETSRELLAHQVRQARAGPDSRPLRAHLMHLCLRDQLHVPHADVAEVARLVLEPAAFKRLVDAPKGRLVDSALPEALPLRQERARELREGEGLWVALAHVGQHVRDVVAKHRVRRDEEHVLGAEALAVLVEQVCDALEKHRCLARTSDAGDEQHGAVLVADDGVLFLLDGRGDRLHLGGALLGQRREKQRILDGDVGVEIGAQLVAHDVELAAQHEVDGDCAAVRAVVRGPHVLVVVHLGDG